MQEQRKTEAEPSRNPETLGEKLILDEVVARGFPQEQRAKGLERIRTDDTPEIETARAIAAIIDTRFAPLTEAAEAVVKRFDNPRDYFGENLSTLVQDLRAAIAKAKGGAQ